MNKGMKDMFVGLGIGPPLKSRIGAIAIAIVAISGIFFPLFTVLHAQEEGGTLSAAQADKKKDLLLARCINDMEGLGRRLERIAGRKSTNSSQCPERNGPSLPAGQGGGKEAVILQAMITKELGGVLPPLSLRRGDHGCQKFDYRLVNGSLMLTGKILKKTRVVNAIRKALVSFSGLQINESGLGGLASCSQPVPDSSFQIAINSKNQRVRCMRSEQATEFVAAMSEHVKCMELGRSLDGMRNLDNVRQFWVSDEHKERAILCLKTDRSWKVRDYNLGTECAWLVTRKE